MTKQRLSNMKKNGPLKMVSNYIAGVKIITRLKILIKDHSKSVSLMLSLFKDTRQITSSFANKNNHYAILISI